jgi:dolichol-phosphate mannosyltransferase
MDGNWSKANRTSATTVTSYRPAQRRAKRCVPGEKLALVIPAMNEAGNLHALLSRVRGALDSAGIAWEVIVVDDDSRDGTEQIVAAISRQDPRVRLLVRRGERGLSGAILHGWRQTDATILGVMDADGQHPAAILPGLVAAIASGRDLVIGSRYATGGSAGWNPVRRLMSTAAIVAARPVQPVGLRLKDPLSGFFLVRRECVEHLSFQTAGFKLLLEILVRGRVTTVEEIPFVFGRRRAGHSKVNVRVAWDYVLLLAKLYTAKYGSVRAQEAPGD